MGRGALLSVVILMLLVVPFHPASSKSPAVEYPRAPDSKTEGGFIPIDIRGSYQNNPAAASTGFRPTLSEMRPKASEAAEAGTVITR